MKYEYADHFEAMSLLKDGELPAENAAALVQAFDADAQLRTAWHSYHLIGEVLRAAPSNVQNSPVSAPAREAANDGVFRWKLVAGVAGMAAVGALVWSFAGGTLQDASQPKLAANTTVPATANIAGASQVQSAQTMASNLDAPQVMIRDPRLDELLAAHKQFGSASALQQPAGFLRNATFQTPQR
jgi:sigma-E factor negative regulatory protein RseA